MIAKRLIVGTITTVLAAAVLAIMVIFGITPSKTSADAADKSVTAAQSTEFTYDGKARTITPKISGFGESASYLWTKEETGETVSTKLSLSVKNVSDSGIYIFTATENGEEASASVTVKITPATVSASWRTHPSPLSAEYNALTAYTYNGILQGVYPIPVKVIKGDSIDFSVIGNTAVNAGEYHARIIRITGEDADNYALNESTAYQSFRIEKAVLKATVPDKEIIYGETLPGYDDIASEIIFEGFVGYESADDLSEKTVISDDYSVGSNAGRYGLGISFVSENYSLKLYKGTLTVSPRQITATFTDSASVYGENPVFNYLLEGITSAVSLPEIEITLSSYSVGKYEIEANCNDGNYIFSYETAMHEIAPRAIIFTVMSDSVFYGNAPEYEIELTEGTYAFDESRENLGIVFSDIPRAIGTFGGIARITSQNYTAPDAEYEITVLPLPIDISISPAVSFYGDPFVTPSYRVESALPYGETAEDVAFEVIKESGRNAGTYKLSGKSGNPCYEATVKTSTYTIAPRIIAVIVDLPLLTDPPVLDEGESISFGYTAAGFVGTDEEEIIIVYSKLTDRGTVEKECYEITESGKYSVSPEFVSPSGNYTISYTQAKTITVYPKVNATGENGNSPVIKLESGFLPEVETTVNTLNTAEYAEKYEKSADLQSVYAVYEINIKGAKDSFAEIRIPVSDETRNYTAAVEKSDGKITFIPCEVKDGYAVFRADLSNTKFLIWQDKDSSPYIATSIILFILLVIELCVYFSIAKKYRLRKSVAYGILPVAGAGGFTGSGIYTFFALTIIEGLACVVFLIAILVMNSRLVRLKRRGY